MTDTSGGDAARIDGVEAVGHPRPLLRRSVWWSLDGTWDFAFDRDLAWELPHEVRFDRRIDVPFAPETSCSGIGDTAYTRRCWYRRTIAAPKRAPDERVVLHFGAVDHAATVWIDGRLVARHEGGYTPFGVDVTAELGDDGHHELVVRADDDPLDLAKPRGKQDWEPEPHSIWYERTTGIWQSVWMETVGPAHVEQIQWHTELDRLEVRADIRLGGTVTTGSTLRIRLRTATRDLVDDTVRVDPHGCRLSRAFVLDATGLDHLRESLLWTPEHPVLVDALLELRDGDGTVVDRVHSYTAVREVAVRDGRFLLNGRPQALRMVLDQGYWADSGLTPPDDDALRRDVEIVKAMGFNAVRKHQKIEDARYLHWADRLGLMVWVEMPPAYQFDPQAIRRTTTEWIDVLERDRSHPSVVAWVPFNESSGLLDLTEREDERNWVRAMTALTKAIDPTRPVVSNDGWETVGGDVIAVHDYEQDPGALVARWNGDLVEPITGYGAHRRRQTLDEDPSTWRHGRPSRPIMLTEIGGIGWRADAPVADGDAGGAAEDDVPQDRMAQPAAWGYSTVSGPDELVERYAALMQAVHAIPRLAGFCYTQLADTYQEINGLLTADRRPKVPVETIAAATRGPGTSFHDPFEAFPFSRPG